MRLKETLPNTMEFELTPQEKDYVAPSTREENKLKEFPNSQMLLIQFE